MCHTRAGEGCVRVMELSKIPQKEVEQKREEWKQRFKKSGKSTGIEICYRNLTQEICLERTIS